MISVFVSEFLGLIVSYVFFFLMIRRPPRSTLDRSSAASDVYKRQALQVAENGEAGSELALHGEGRCVAGKQVANLAGACLLYTSPSPRDRTRSRMPSSA